MTVSTESSFFSPAGGVELFCMAYPTLSASLVEIFTARASAFVVNVLFDPDSTSSLSDSVVEAVSACE